MSETETKVRIYFECKGCGTYQFITPPRPCRYQTCGSKSFKAHIEKRGTSLFAR